MNAPPKFELAGPLSRHPVVGHDPLIEGRRYRVWLRIAAISQGSVCVWVGGNRSSFFTSPGEHVEEVVAGERQDVMVQGLDAVATIDGVAVKAAAPES
jgi:hypothetical protein